MNIDPKDQNYRTALLDSIGKSVRDVSEEGLEITLHHFFKDDQLLKEIPIVKTFVAVGKVASSIQNAIFLKKLLVFLHTFNKGIATEGEIKTFRKKLSGDPAHCAEVTEHITMIIDRVLDTKKAKAFSLLFSAYVAKRIDWEKFVALSVVLEQLNPLGFKALRYFVGKSPKMDMRNFEGEALLYGAGIAHRHGSSFRVSDLGKELFKYAIAPLSDGT